jgi:hypothetical protein
MISGMAGSPCSIRRDGSLSGHEGIQRGRPRPTGKGLFWPNHPLERTRHTAAAPLSFVRSAPVHNIWTRVLGETCCPNRLYYHHLLFRVAPEDW